MAERNRSIADAETSTALGAAAGCGCSARGSRTGTSGLERWPTGAPAGDGRGSAAAGGGGTATMLGAAGGGASTGSAPRAAGRATGRVFNASRRRPSSLTTAARPIRIKPPVSPVTPVTMSVVPRVNSLIGIPNPIAATPTAAIRMPSKYKITDIRPRSTLQRPAALPALNSHTRVLWLLKNFVPLRVRSQQPMWLRQSQIRSCLTRRPRGRARRRVPSVAPAAAPA